MYHRESKPLIKYDRPTCIKKIFDISDRYRHTADVEQMAIYIADQNEYSKEIAYLSCILAAKVHKRGYYQLQQRAYQMETSLYDLEKEMIKKVKFYNINFISCLGKVLNDYNVDKTPSHEFTEIARYLSWYQMDVNFYTVILAIQLSRKRDFPLMRLMKYHKLYILFKKVSEEYDVTMKELIMAYNKLN